MISPSSCFATAGSSPQAWGILRLRHQSEGILRFIPTSVGNTGSDGCPTACGTVHPHKRGEYVFLSKNKKQYPGSSPQAWGILLDGIQAMQIIRFIPTSVGNTVNVTVPYSQLSVHPHKRGEYSLPRFALISCAGSSPQAWGILHEWCFWERGERFIPTSVGNTSSRSPTHAPFPVHPHKRGEYTPPSLNDSRLAGSSPQAWGIRSHIQVTTKILRFIPTSVGNTTPGMKKSVRVAVHPHKRGEYALSHDAGYGIYGSSPQAWGILLIHQIFLFTFRFIPTSVGNTEP